MSEDARGNRAEGLGLLVGGAVLFLLGVGVTIATFVAAPAGGFFLVATPLVVAGGHVASVGAFRAITGKRALVVGPGALRSLGIALLALAGLSLAMALLSGSDRGDGVRVYGKAAELALNVGLLSGGLGAFCLIARWRQSREG